MFSKILWFFKRIEHIELRFCIWFNLVLCSVFPSIPWGVGKSRLLSSGTILLHARKLSPVRGEVEPGSILRLFSVIWFGFCVFETRYIEPRLALNSQCSPGCGPCDPPLATASWAIGLQARATTPGVKHTHYVYSGITPAGAHRPWSVVSYSCVFQSTTCFWGIVYHVFSVLSRLCRRYCSAMDTLC